MKRRGFLSFLGGAAVAGPSMARAAVTPVAESLSVPGVGLPSGYYGGGMPSMDEGEDIAREVTRLRTGLAKLLGRSAEDLARERRSMSANWLDPDLAAMQSLSLDYRLKKQRDRNFQRQQEEQRGWIESRIADLLNS